jgi:hypothetical protein
VGSYGDCGLGKISKGTGSVDCTPSRAGLPVTSDSWGGERL